jgi:septum formation protein
VLASNSPRRKELLAGIDVDFKVRIIQDIDESYPADLPTKDIAEYISRKKAAVYQQQMADDELIITADTIVVLGNEVMGKPHDEADASRMLHELSGQTHQVITGVTLTTTIRQQSFSVETDVTFKALSDEEINYYVQHYKPFDKAGAYGIQGIFAPYVKAISGDYNTVVGFPLARVYHELKEKGYYSLPL